VLNLVTARLPDVSVRLREMVTRDQVAALISGEIDLGIARPPFDMQVFRSRLLHREALLAALPEPHPLAGLGRPLGAVDLAGEPVIMHSPLEARYFYDLVVGLLPTVHTRVVHTVSQIVTMIWLVAAGRGIAFVPASAAGLGVPGVVFAPLDTAVREPVELHLLWLREATDPPLHSVLRVLEQPA
jgi:DNA-binding transcriptional LysR family regulator